MKTIGILLEQRIFRNIKRGKTKFERISFYNKAASKYGLIPLYLCLERISAKTGKAYGYKYINGRYRYGKFAIPKVIHNRTFPVTPKARAMLSYLKKRAYVFNAQNRYSKYRIHRLLLKKFKSHLPSTINYTPINLFKMMRKYNSLYIKPQSSSVGEGIMKITQIAPGRWKLQKPTGSIVIPRQQVIRAVHRIAKKKKYLVQETIQLATFRGNPFDIRVSVQRGAKGYWQVTGMVGKVARKGSHVTNVARGGKVRRCSVLFAQNPMEAKKTLQSVRMLALDISRYLGQKLKRLADVGLDIGVDQHGKPYFIELNCRDQRYSFRQAKMKKTYYRTYETPMQYAKYLLDKRS